MGRGKALATNSWLVESARPTVRSSSKESMTASRPMQFHDVDKTLLEELLHEIELLSAMRHPDLVLHLGRTESKMDP